MKVLSIINGLGFSSGTGIGGADKRALEVSGCLANEGNTFDILTTTSGERIFKEQNFSIKYLTISPPFWWPKFLENLTFFRIISYFYATFLSSKFLRASALYDIFIASSDFFFDVIPAYIFKTYHKKKMVCVIHHFIKSPRKRKGPLLFNFLLFISQQISFKFIKFASDAVFLYDTPEGREIYNRFFNKSNVKVFYVKNGVDANLIDSVTIADETFDGIFVGGIRPSKGVMDLPLIWKLVCQDIPQAKLLIIGGGDSLYTQNLKDEIIKTKMKDNIILKGPLPSRELVRYLKASKIFLFPSYEEGWGIALTEAMYSSLPVICYDLPAYKIFGDSLQKAPIGNKNMLAKFAVELLLNENLHKKISTQSKLIAKEFTWEKVAKEDYNYLLSVLK